MPPPGRPPRRAKAPDPRAPEQEGPAGSVRRGRTQARKGRPARTSEAGAGRQGERLQKVLARAGFGSRRAAEDLIRDGRVSIDGRLATLGDRVDPLTERVSVDGVPVPADPDLRYLALNKPRGVTTTMRDPHAERTIAGLIPPWPRVFPVGRLDRESEGLLLLMNDGELAHRLQHPSFGIEKEYLVEVEGSMPRSAARRLVAGVELVDGRARAARVGPLERSGGRSAVRLVMLEGKKREVRRMFDAVGYRVSRLVRVRFGPVRLEGLAPGVTRALDAEEIQALYRATSLDQAAVRPAQRRLRLPKRSRVGQGTTSRRS